MRQLWGLRRRPSVTASSLPAGVLTPVARPVERRLWRALGRLALRLAALVAAAAVACAFAPAAEQPHVPIPAGVTVSGVAVGGLAAEPARELLRRAFARTIRFRADAHRWSLPATKLGAAAEVDVAVTAALSAKPGQDVELPVASESAAIRRYVRTLARRFARAPQNARLVGLNGLRPAFAEAVPGRKLDEPRARLAIERALRDPLRRTVVKLPFQPVSPSVTVADFGPVVVIARESKRLTLYSGTVPIRTMPVATGSAEYPTPLGTFSISIKDANPWWRPPPSEWAEGLKPVPPGPGNPLGTRWMGLNAYSVGIHGTPDAASIGYSASHGCVRMYVPDAEWLFDRVTVGTPVVIVSA